MTLESRKQLLTADRYSFLGIFHRWGSRGMFHSYRSGDVKFFLRDTECTCHRCELRRREKGARFCEWCASGRNASGMPIAIRMANQYIEWWRWKNSEMIMMGKIWAVFSCAGKYGLGLEFICERMRCFWSIETYFIVSSGSLCLFISVSLYLETERCCEMWVVLMAFSEGTRCALEIWSCSDATVEGA